MGDDRTIADPTTAALLAQRDERDQLRAENLLLHRELTAAGTQVKTLKAERDADRRGWEWAEEERDAAHGRAELCAQDAIVARGEVERLRERCGGTFVAGYDQAVRELRDHFAKAGDHGTVHVIETIWLRRLS